MRFFVALVCLIISTQVMANDLLPTPEHLELYPKGRAAYQEKFDSRAEQYEVNARNYIDDLYDNHSEGNKTSEPMLPESTLDAVLDSAGQQTAAAQKNKAAVMNPAAPSLSDIPSLNVNTSNTATGVSANTSP